MMAATRKTKRARGFTLIAVLMMFIVIGAAVAALGVAFATENRRTIGTLTGTQLRELLLASGPAAEEELKLHGAGAREVLLATPLPEAKVMLAIKPGGEGKAEVRVEARMGRSAASQMLVYARSGDRWVVESARLGADGTRVSDFSPQASTAPAVTVERLDAGR